MAQTAITIDVGKDETTQTLLGRLNTVPPGSYVHLRLPYNAHALRVIDDFNDLRQLARTRNVQFMITSPEKGIRGLAGILGFEVEGKATAPAAAAPARPAPAPPPLAYTPPVPVPAAPLTDNDWLHSSGGVDVDPLVEAPGGNTTGPAPAAPIVGNGAVAPPPGPAPRIMGSAPARPVGAPPAATAPPVASVVPPLDPAKLDEAEAAFRADIAQLTTAAPPAVPAAREGRPPGRGGLFGGRGAGSAAPAALAGAAAGVAASAVPDESIYVVTPPVAPAAPGAGVAPLEGTLTRGEVLRAGGGATVIAPRPHLQPGPQPTVRAQRRSRGGWIGALLLLLLLLLAGGAAWVFLPPLLTQATVVVAPGSEQVRREVFVPVNLSGAPGQGGTVTGPPAVGITGNLTGTAVTDPLPTGPLAGAPVQAQTFSATISEEGSAPTTGVREQPAGLDRIALALTNPNRSAVTLAAGTEVFDDNAVTFRTVNAVTVPAATDTGTSLVYGQASVEAEAVEAGPHTVPARTVAGTFGSGVRFYNTIAASGGYMEKIATVSQEDVDRLRAELFGRLQPQVNAAILQQVPADMVALPATLDVPAANWQTSLDRAVGDDATDIRMKITVSGAVKAYRPAEVTRAVEQAVQGSVQGAAPGAPRLAGPVEQGPLVEEATANGLVYRTSVTATVQYAITPAMEQQIIDLVRGRPVAEAERVVRAQFEQRIQSVQVTAGFWNFQRDLVPDDPKRIIVRRR